MMAEQVTMWRSKAGGIFKTQEEAEHADRKAFLTGYLEQFWEHGEFHQDAAIEAMLKDFEITVKP